MKRWSITSRKRELFPKVDAFLEAIDVVCKQHGFAICHEDEHGAFIVRLYSDYSSDWLESAFVDES